MKNSRNFHGSCFLTLKFSPPVCRICRVESFFSKSKVTNLKISGGFFRKRKYTYILFEYTEIKIRENFLTGHKFTNLLKSVPPWGIFFFYFLASYFTGNGFATIEREGNSWKKYQNEIKSSLKKCQMLCQCFPTCMRGVQPSWHRIEKITFTTPEIQIIKKLNNPTTTSFARGSLLNCS